MKAALGAAALALALGCASPVEETPSSSNLPSQARLSAKAPLGPKVIKAFPFDYAGLPRLTEVELAAEPESGALAFSPGPSGPELAMEGGLVAEIEIEIPRDVTSEDGRHWKDASPVIYHVFRMLDAGGPSAWTPAPGVGRFCGKEGRPGRARWQGYLDRSRTAAGLPFVCYEGSFDPKTCSARAERAFRVVARPLVGGELFGFRAQAGACSSAGERPEELLALVGPRPSWIGTSAPLLLLPTDGLRSFTRVVVPVSRSVSASVVVDARSEDVQLFHNAEVRVGPSLALFSFSVDVVWAPADAAPAAMGLLSLVRED